MAQPDILEPILVGEATPEAVKARDKEIVDAFATGHSGTARPVYVQAGMHWLDTAANPWLWKFYDGAADIIIRRVDATTDQVWDDPDVPEIDVAAAATTNILGTASPRARITGTVAKITSFGNGKNKIRFVRAAADVLVENNAAIICPGGSDFQLLAGMQFIVFSSASGVARIGPGTKADGTSLRAAPAYQIGQPFDWVTDTPPFGALAADGSEISRSTYAELFTKIGTTFGAGDGETTFNLPDDRGLVRRGWDNGRGYDPGRVLGSEQADMVGNHGHPWRRSHSAQNSWGSSGSGGIPYGTSGVGTWPAYDGDPTSTAGQQIGGNGGDETRGKNRAYLACIWAYY